MDFTREELEDLLCNADDLHELVYALAEKGFLEEEALNAYLNAADSIGGKKT
jgi:hypothetical protein